MNKDLCPKTCIIRHRRENLKKCSLTALQGQEGFAFYTYPQCIGKLPDLTGYMLLDMDGEPLSKADKGSNLVVVDATWRLSVTMLKMLPELHRLPKRSIPKGILTAYPRRQEDCGNPEAGLASIEALYIAYRLLGFEAEFLLENYYWKSQFLSKNRPISLTVTEGR